MKIVHKTILMTIVWLIVIVLYVSVFSGDDEYVQEVPTDTVVEEVQETIEEEVVTVVDSETDTLIGSNGWTAEYHTDGESVFYKKANSQDDLVKLVGADLNTFETTNIFTARDAYHTYVQDVVVDLNSFEELGNYYAKDQHRIYYTSGLGSRWNTYFEGADAASFEVIDDWYAKDQYAVYGPCYGYEWSCLSEIEGADVTTFEVLEDGFTRDTNSIYYLTDEIQGADPDSFTLFPGELAPFNGNFYIDSDAIYYLNAIHEFRFDEIDTSSLSLIETESRASESETHYTDQYVYLEDDENQYIIIFTQVDHSPIGTYYEISIEVIEL